MRILLLCLFLTVSAHLAAQRIKTDSLMQMLSWTQRQVDTTLKKKGYLLMQKDVDSTSSLFQYSHNERRNDAPFMVRSLILMDATVGNIKARMLTYRTYDKTEFSDMAVYLLSQNYHKTNEFDLGEEHHTLYSNGSREIRLKRITSMVGNKKKTPVTSYEIIVGQ